MVRTKLIAKYILWVCSVPGFISLSFLLGLFFPFFLSWLAHLAFWVSNSFFGYNLSSLLTISSSLRDVILSGPFYFSALKVCSLGFSVIVLSVFFLDLFFPSFFNSKILEMLYSEYMMEKLRENYDRVRKLSRKIAEVQIKFGRSAPV